MGAAGVEVHLLGGFEVVVDGEVVDDATWRRRPAASLVKLLALAPGRRLHREQVVDALWPDATLDEAMPRLHKAAHFARRALGGGGLVLRGDVVALLPDQDVLVDAVALEAALAAGLRDDGPGELAAALDAHPGELLPADPYEEWLAEPRRRLRALRVEALRRLGRWDDVLALEPTDERAHLAAMRAHLAAGDHPAALRQYAQLAQALQDELGTTPGAEVELLRRTLVTGAGDPVPAALEDGPDPVDEGVRFCTTPDGTRLAWMASGAGAPLVKAANWLTHLDYDVESPVWRHWWRALARGHRLVRYDERGSGLSDWATDRFDLDAWVDDLAAVLDAAGLERVPLLGVSQGAAVAVVFAARHPERVSALVLYGGYVLGPAKRATTDEERRRAAVLPELAELGWGTDDPSFRQVFTARFMPDGTAEQWRALNELQRRTTSPANAAAFLRGFAQIDVGAEARQVQAPTLILHARGDQMPPVDQGRQLAALIPESRFVSLESNNHILFEHEPAWTRFLLEVERFLAEHA